MSIYAGAKMQMIVKGIPPLVTKEEIGDFLRGFNSDLNSHQLFAEDQIASIEIIEITEPLTQVQTRYAVVECGTDKKCQELIKLINQARFNGLRLQAGEYLNHIPEPFSALFAKDRCTMEITKI